MNNPLIINDSSCKLFLASLRITILTINWTKALKLTILKLTNRSNENERSLWLKSQSSLTQFIISPGLKNPKRTLSWALKEELYRLSRARININLEETNQMTITLSLFSQVIATSCQSWISFLSLNVPCQNEGLKK